MKLAMLIFLVFAGCGRSECQDYARIICDKLYTCFGIEDRAKCEADEERHSAALRTPEAECASLRDHIAAMTCAEIRALVASSGR